METFAVPPPPRIVVPVQSGEKFPVRRVFCVGRNYAAHAREMGADAREKPFFFMKPADALVTGGADISYPPGTASLHHEVELVVAIGQGGADIAPARALAHVYGYAVGLDLTRRDLQEAAKAARRPWDMAKGFDGSGPIGTISRPAQPPVSGRIFLKVNDKIVQDGDLSAQIWPVEEVIAHLSSLVRLAPGDLIFTGTPEGVGPLVRGDALHGEIEGVGTVTTRIS